MSTTPAAPSIATALTPLPGHTEPLQTVLVIDDSSMCRDSVSKVIQNAGFAVVTAGEGESGLEQLENNSCDLVLLDNEMPNMNGLSFLKALRGDARWVNLPVVMLTTSNAKAVIVEAIKYKIAGYVLKEHVAMSALVQRVKQVIAQARGKKPTIPMNVPNLIPRDTAICGVASGDTIRTLAGIVRQVAAIEAASKNGTADLAAIVKQDPVLAARVIQLARSSAYNGTKAQMSSIDDAVRIVGVTAVQNLTASFGIFSAFPEDRADGLELLRCWQHSFAVAAVMSRLVPKSDAVPPGLPYLIGLCHDLAEISLRQKFPMEYTTAEDYAAQSGVSTLEMLPKVFGVSLAELTQSLLEKLKFPPQVSDPINELHKANASCSFDVYRSLLARTLVISNMMAHGMLLTASADNLVSPVPLGDCRSSLIPSGKMNVAEILSEAVTTVHLLADVVPEQEQSLSKPIVGRCETSVYYLRHPSLAHLDPLEVALKSLARTEVREKLGSHEELSNYDGIIAVAPHQQDPLLSGIARLRAQMKKPLPILKLCAASEGQGLGYTSEGTARYPMSIKDLAQFVATLPTSVPAETQAA